MRMSYTTNDKLPGIRAQAVMMLRSGKSTREVSKYFGYAQSTIVKWNKKASEGVIERIETKSSAPKSSPGALPKKMVARVVETRLKTKRCAEVIHRILKDEGINISLSSVKRVLSRYNLTKKRGPWKKRRVYPKKPDILAPGDLVELDTIHFVDREKKRSYLYTAIDVYSRYGYALLSEKANAHQSIKFLKACKESMPFNIKNTQSDNGPEFGKYFKDHTERIGINHRYTHPRSPNENGHLERFNRTIQEEMLRFGKPILVSSNIKDYLKHYNHQRLHMGIDFKTPQEMLE
jgi:transposase InsO family protein